MPSQPLPSLPDDEDEEDEEDQDDEESPRKPKKSAKSAKSKTRRQSRKKQDDEAATPKPSKPGKAKGQPPRKKTRMDGDDGGDGTDANDGGGGEGEDDAAPQPAKQKTRGSFVKDNVTIPALPNLSGLALAPRPAARSWDAIMQDCRRLRAEEGLSALTTAAKAWDVTDKNLSRKAHAGKVADAMQKYCLKIAKDKGQKDKQDEKTVDENARRLGEWDLLSNKAFEERAKLEWIKLRAVMGGYTQKWLDVILRSFDKPARSIDIEDDEDVKTLAQELLDQRLNYYDVAMEAHLRGVPLPRVTTPDPHSEKAGFGGIMRTAKPPDIEYHRLAVQIATAMHRDR